MERQTVHRLGMAHTREGAEKTAPKWWTYAPEFPRWYVWRGVTGLYYARIPGISPQRVLRAPTADELRDKIARYVTPRRTVALSNVLESLYSIQYGLSFHCDHYPDDEAPP
jgi:hypothetical protein